MRGFAQRSHERKELGAKSHAFSGWKGPPKITKNEVYSRRLALRLSVPSVCPLARIWRAVWVLQRRMYHASIIGAVPAWLWLREASGRFFVKRAKTIRLNERFGATMCLSFYPSISPHPYCIASLSPVPPRFSLVSLTTFSRPRSIFLTTFDPPHSPTPPLSLPSCAWQHSAWEHGLSQETGMGSILSRAMKNVKI